MASSKPDIPLIVVFVLCGVSLVMSRQMCYTCQFVLNGPGIECVSDPEAWKGGEPRMKCPNKCTIMAEYDANTGDPTFFHRGCGVAGEQKNGCMDNGARHSCFYSCGGDGNDYCNDKSLPRSPMVDKDEENGGLSPLRTSSLRVLFPLALSVAVWLVLGKL